MSVRQTANESRRTSHSTFRRVGLVLLGIVLGLAGWVAWGVETEYGSGDNSQVRVIGDQATVYEVDEQTGTTDILFEGTEAEAFAFDEERRTSGRNYLVPVLILLGGAGCVLWGAWPRRRAGPRPT